MVPLDDPDVKATETFRFELAAVDTWPVTVKLVPLPLIVGKHDDGGLFTAVTVALRVFPFWLKFAVRVVLGGVLPLCAAGAKVIVHVPVTTGVRFELFEE